MNRRPLAPQASTLAKLSYTPNSKWYYSIEIGLLQDDFNKFFNLLSQNSFDIILHSFYEEKSGGRKNMKKDGGGSFLSK